MDWIDVQDRFGPASQAARKAVHYAGTRLLPVQAFFFLNCALIFGLGTVLCFLRFMTDIHSAVQTTFVHIFLVAIFWILVLLFYAGLLIACVANRFPQGVDRRQAKRTETLNIKTMFIVLAFLEMFGFGLLTHHVFTTVPRSAVIDDHKKILHVIQSDNKDFPRKINDFLTLVGESNKGNFILLFYDLKEKPGFVWEEDKMRQELKAETCGYFADPARYGSIDHFVHIFMSGEVHRYSFLISRKDCS